MKLLRPSTLDSAADRYFERFGFCPQQIQALPHPDLGLTVVIPCADEPDLRIALDSLRRADPPEFAVEILVVINSSEQSGAAVRARNDATLQRGLAWTEACRDERFQVHFLHFPNFPAKLAGVGLARKIGMDESLRRFADLNRVSAGIIAGFDADCQCDSNYFRALENLFRAHRSCPGCSIYFEHPLAGELSESIYAAITAYELHLRYYVQALRFAGFPYAHHTIGSSFAVRAEAYQRQGGMNKRQAGEDFYFLQKIIPLGNFRDLTDTVIRPSPRASHRVPFGTGRAVTRYLETGAIETYPWNAFLDLKETITQMPRLAAQHISALEFIESLPSQMSEFLGKQNFPAALEEIRMHSAAEESFRKRFFAWFDGFRAMKFVHFARDHFYGPGQIEREPGRLLAALNQRLEGKETRLRGLLEHFRRLERCEASD